MWFASVDGRTDADHAKAIAKHGIVGERNEEECPGPINSGMFSAILERGDVKGVFCGQTMSTRIPPIITASCSVTVEVLVLAPTGLQVPSATDCGAPGYTICKPPVTMSRSTLKNHCLNGLSPAKYREDNKT